jgi:chromosome segregation ATPase
MDRRVKFLDREGFAAQVRAERERVAGIYTDLEDTLSGARKEYSAAEKQLAAAEVKAQQTTEAHAQATRDLEGTQLRARDAVLAAGFPDESAAKDAALGTADIKRLETEVKTWQRDRDATEKRVTELEGQLEDGGASAESLCTAEAQFSARKTKHDSARDERARLSQEISQLAERVKRAKKLTISEIRCREAWKEGSLPAHDMGGSSIDPRIAGRIHPCRHSSEEQS